MYSDCEHEIKPVTTGHRVTFTYNLYRPAAERVNQSSSSSSSNSAAALTAARESAFGEQLGSALRDASWYPAGVTLGLVLEHFYAVATLEECVQEGGASDDDERPCGNMPPSILPTNLKGSDMQLCRAARALGLPVRILPVVSLKRWEWGQVTKAEPGPLSPSKLEVVGSFGGADTWEGGWSDGGDDDWAKFLRTGKPDRGYGSPPRRILPPAADIPGDLLWVQPPGTQHLKYCDPASQYDGNSGSTRYYHAAAVLLVMVPPADAPA
jgi:hypothetical protein